MLEDQIRRALDAHWQASASGDLNAEHNIYADDAICDYPQSGERILGRKIFKPCAAITPVILPASTSGAS